MIFASRHYRNPAAYVAGTAAVMVAWGTAIAGAQSGPVLPDVTIGRVLEISVRPPAGKTFDLEVSADLTTWQSTGTRIFRTSGETVSATVPFEDGPSYFRWKEVADPGGLAPETLFRTGLLLTQGEIDLHYSFGRGNSGRVTRGEDDGTNFLWIWRRTGADTGTVSITDSKGAEEVLELTFASSKAGVFVRKRGQSGAIPRAESGSFVVSSGLSDAEAPSRVRNSRLVVSDPAGFVCMTFLSERLGVCSGSGPFRFNSRRTNRDRKLVLDVALDNKLDQEYELQFTSRESGTFVRRILSKGVLQDEDTGTFSFSRDDRD